jgi:dsDNA-specific endonuclease/ATPase MutS2
MEEQKDKRVLNIELGNEVKKVSITGINSDEKVVMRQELSEDELDQATGGRMRMSKPCLNVYYKAPDLRLPDRPSPLGE